MSKTITKIQGLFPGFSFGDIMKDDYVKVKDYIPDIYVELRYATERNFTHTKVYDFNEAYLRLGTTLKLKKVQEEL